MDTPKLETNSSVVFDSRRVDHFSKNAPRISLPGRKNLFSEIGSHVADLLSLLIGKLTTFPRKRWASPAIPLFQNTGVSSE